MKWNVILAIFKRNFLGYFSNPTGYVFICGFVLASGFAAFWPHEFFNSNLANLDQLNHYLPFIMLFFVPAITMSVWAEERRQGTDELLLTIPAGDIDVVVGKYLAVAAIFSVSLVFSFSNLIILYILGSPDFGLMMSTYLGYWMVGVTMLSIGMAASFLTKNITVGFVLGVAFNVPLVFAATSDTIIAGSEMAQLIREWSITAKFQDFARGVISVSSIVYFFSIVAVMLYICMVLIGRRHWASGAQGSFNYGHYVTRVAALFVAAIGLSMLFGTKDFVRLDVSSEGLSSLSSKTTELLEAIPDKWKIHLEAYVSPEKELPESYIQTRLNLLNTLSELTKRSGGKITSTIHATESFKKEATVADQRFGIRPQRVYARERGKLREMEVYMGVAVIAGLDKKVIPFFDRGIPPEYELVRSIVSLTSNDNKKRVGVVNTDARLMQAASPHGGRGSQRNPLIVEIEKQHDAIEVDPNRAIEKDFDVLLVVQPSTLQEHQLQNLFAAIRDGTPAAIFEDPQPFLNEQLTATSVPRGGASRFQNPRQPQPAPKGNISGLWKLLGVNFDANHIVWQNYNPYPKAEHFPDEFVFVGKGSGQKEAFNSSHSVTSGLQQLLLLCTGSFTKSASSPYKFEPLLRTGRQTGTVEQRELFFPFPFGGRRMNPNRKATATQTEYTLAARISGKAKGDKKDQKSKDDSKAINVILVADSDLLAPAFLNIRTQGDNPEMDFHLDVDNVTFVLNVIDELAGDDRFVEIRKKRRAHRTLTAFERRFEQTRVDVKKAKVKFDESFMQAIQDEQEKIQERVKKIITTPGIDDRQREIQIETAREQLEKALTVKRARLERERDASKKKAESELELEVRETQHRVKLYATFLPPILPLGIGLAVFFSRRSRELEGASASRVRGTGGASGGGESSA